MTWTTPPSAGAKLRASVLSALILEGRPIRAQKAGDTSRSGTSSRTADPDLVLALSANTTYEYSGLFLVSSAANAAGDFSYELQYPSDAVITAGGSGLHNSLASGSTADVEAIAYSLDATSPTSQLPYGASTNVTGIIVRGEITLVTAGNLTVAWAQVASNGNATVLKGGSFLIARKSA
jgi:hypothetical protein